MRRDITTCNEWVRFICIYIKIRNGEEGMSIINNVLSSVNKALNGYTNTQTNMKKKKYKDFYVVEVYLFLANKDRFKHIYFFKNLHPNNQDRVLVLSRLRGEEKWKTLLSQVTN